MLPMLVASQVSFAVCFTLILFIKASRLGDNGISAAFTVAVDITNSAESIDINFISTTVHYFGLIASDFV